MIRCFLRLKKTYVFPNRGPKARDIPAPGAARVSIDNSKEQSAESAIYLALSALFIVLGHIKPSTSHWAGISRAFGALTLIYTFPQVLSIDTNF